MSKTFHFTLKQGTDIYTMDGETFDKALHELAETLDVLPADLHYVPPIALEKKDDQGFFIAPEDPGLTEADHAQWRYEHGWSDPV